MLYTNDVAVGRSSNSMPIQAMTNQTRYVGGLTRTSPTLIEHTAGFASADQLEVEWFNRALADEWAFARGLHQTASAPEHLTGSSAAATTPPSEANHRSHHQSRLAGRCI